MITFGVIFSPNPDVFFYVIEPHADLYLRDTNRFVFFSLSRGKVRSNANFYF